ncbi:MarR family winged helix-turn-helix transcriptional regulator [Achromobacter sp. DH1f]|uniref:MarR family winged helix-turn-helix transcriptional regulator n=1 Tax=Achromobacter sp. DH1f TaxID=1397275 RepID=UPI00046A6D11|nr:MarR family transcriptional regulator [Achromobacter sp. DH1f]
MADPVDWQPRQMPTLLINQYARVMAKQVDERLRPLGVTASQLPVLVALKGGGRMTQKALAETTGVEQPSMAQLLARMERDGLVRREPSPTDGRSSLVSLTPAAMRKLEPGRAVLKQMDDEACAIFEPAERELLARLLLRLVESAYQ